MSTDNRHLRVVGRSVNPEPTEEDPPKPPRNMVVEMILEELCDDAIASITSDDPAEALRIARHRAYWQLSATWPKGSGL